MAEALQHELDQVLADLEDANKKANSLDATNFNLRQQIENASVNTIAQLKADLEGANH
jgi:peptidoglycan hydrolase CwlO-like protein